MIETDRNLRDQSTVWISSNFLNNAKLGDVYVIYVKDQANNTVSQQVAVNKTSGTLWGELTPEEKAEQDRNNNNNSNNNNSSAPSKPADTGTDIKKDTDKALSEVITISDDTPANSGSGQITVDLSSMLSALNKNASLANARYRLELTEKSTGYLVYSKILTDTNKIVIPDLDDASTYIVQVVIIDANGNVVNSKSFEQATPDRTPPIISSLKTQNSVLTVSAKDNVRLADEAYRYELVSVNISTASTSKEIDVQAINRLKKSFAKVASNEWNLNTWTSENKLENVEVNMIIKTVVKDNEGNTSEKIIVVDNEPKEYVNVLNPDNPYILRIDTTGDMKSYFGTGDYEYSSSDTTIATVDENGIITGHRKGEVIITAKDKKTGNVKQLLVKIRNVNIIDLRRIIVEKDSLTNLVVLYKEQLQTILGATAGIKWETEDSNIAVVDNSGLLKAENYGLTKIKAIYKDKKIDVYVIVAQAGSIKSDIQEINIQAPYVIKKGTNINLNQIIKCKDFKELDTKTNEFTVYEVSDETILKLSQDGSIQAIMEGTAEITAIDLVNNVFSKIKILVTDISPVKINYTDVSHHWSKKFFETEVTKSIIRGYPDNQFKPDNKVTNSEFLAMLSKTLLIKEQALKTDRSEMMYNGLNQNDPMYNYAASVLVNVRPIYSTLVFGNIMSGKETITRGEVAELLMALTQGKLERKVKKYNFKDLDEKPHEDALRYCIETGIFNGGGNNMILGEKTLTRAEMLVVMNRLSELLK
ncbi:S-layer homology domain-containing protein [Ruminiclostridium cellobioparum]|uniref:S-layer homology domain-containing protein n=1 Tax=Ruminiclostridium cellobioparum TaxID=29355 RepID=UPI0028A934FC|nr:S-layer homology domain-containing protein [Ruminiclostridium cellobioparum]